MIVRFYPTDIIRLLDPLFCRSTLKVVQINYFCTDFSNSCTFQSYVNITLSEFTLHNFNCVVSELSSLKTDSAFMTSIERLARTRHFLKDHHFRVTSFND